jgi:putative membrane protein
MPLLKVIPGTVAVLLFGTASAQEVEPQSTDPAAASSPHQRETTGENVPEEAVSTNPDPAAASSSHQREVTGKAGSESGAADDPDTFVKKAALGGMTEVELARLALSKSSDANIKAFASQMIQDHERANEELLSLARRNQIKAPVALDATHKAMVEKLGFKSGTDFDRSYARQMVQDHHETIALFEGASRSANADISSFARKTLPTLKRHDAMARAL